MTTALMPRQPRSTAAVYGGVAVVLLVVLATVALVVAPPSPPGVAEFAPQADATIEDAPLSQSSQFGDGSGGCAAGQTCEGAAASTTTTTLAGSEAAAGGTPP